jgi:hypothetical protein
VCPYNRPMSELFPVVQIGYWLALATWTGSVLFILIAAPIILRAVEEADPTLPKVLSVNLEGQHSTLLAGTIVANLLTALTQLALICAAVLVLTIAVQLARQSEPTVYVIGRLALFVGALVLTLYNWRVVWPKIEKHRQEYINNADNPELAEPAQAQFDRYHRETETILKITVLLLVGMIVFSALFSTTSHAMTIVAGR